MKRGAQARVVATSTASCVPEFGQCGLAGRECCAPHRCFRQSRWYSQCGSACPRGRNWDCSSDAPSVGILVGRWGGWPAWTPVFLRTLAANPTISFLLLSEEPPPNVGAMPANVEHHAWTLEALLRRLQRTGTLPPGGMCHPAFFRQCPMHPAGGSQGSGRAYTPRSAASAAGG